MQSKSKKQKTNKSVDNIFLLQNEKLHTVDDQMIEKQQIQTVKDMLRNIRKTIIVLEHYNLNNKIEESDDLMNEIYLQDDVVYKFVKINRWRRGTGYLCLQISSNTESRISGKPIGCARVCCFTTNTIHHEAVCFGTTPDTSHGMLMIKEYIESEEIISDLNKLKLSHPTKLSAKTLHQYIKY